MKMLKDYQEYDDYVDHQKEKTLDPVRRKKWLGEEWDLKLNGFIDIFETHKNILKPDTKALCIGARTGQEVVALQSIDVDAIGIDLVANEPHVIFGDMHNLNFDDSSFDFVFTNVFDHSLYPDKMISEIERVLIPGGSFLLQMQVQQEIDEYAENEIDSVNSDIIPLFKDCDVIVNTAIVRNFAGMNWEILVKKQEMKNRMINDIEDLIVPEEYQKIWNDINLPIQIEKGKSHNLPQEELDECLTQLSNRGYYLVSIAEQFGVKTIAEVGTAQGWQFYTFAHYAKQVDGFVWSCDIRDVRNKEYVQKYSDVTDFVSGTSEQMAETIRFSGEKIDMFYIDGWHERGSVLEDVKRLKEFQSDDPIWIFDDYDDRFGCSYDIEEICDQMPDHYVYRVGNAASGQPNHQVAVFGRIE